jgi:hypothetical protein
MAATQITPYDDTDESLVGWIILIVIFFIFFSLAGWAIAASDPVSRADRLRFDGESYEARRDGYLRGGILFVTLVGWIVAYVYGVVVAPLPTFGTIAALLSILYVLNNIHILIYEEDVDPMVGR